MHVHGDALVACKISIHVGTPSSAERVGIKPTARVEACSVGGSNKSVPYALQSRARHFDRERG